MEHPDPIELTDAELDVVSGGHFVGIKQSNSGGNVITKSGGGGGGAAAFGFINSNTQTNTNSGSAVNVGGVGV